MSQPEEYVRVHYLAQYFDSRCDFCHSRLNVRNPICSVTVQRSPGEGVLNRGSYRIRLADRRYWREQIKCQDACPVHTDARGYVRAIAEGDYEAAYLIARGPNPLASNCGRVCGAPCEAACRRGSIDQPIAIRALKRFVSDQHSGHLRAPGEFFEGDCDGLEEMTNLARFLASREYQ